MMICKKELTTSLLLNLLISWLTTGLNVSHTVRNEDKINVQILAK